MTRSLVVDPRPDPSAVGLRPGSSSFRSLRDTSLEDLLVRCADRDEVAFAEYYRVTSPVLNTFLCRRGHSQGLREAILERVYVAMWRRAEEFAHHGTGSAWAWTLAILEGADAPPERVSGLGSAR